MENCFLFYKTLNKFFLVLVVIYSIILIACSDFGTEFNENNKDKWHGKLSVDFIHSILNQMAQCGDGETIVAVHLVMERT